MTEYISGAKRKLVPKQIIDDIYDLTSIGVPLAKVLKDKDLDACRPVIARLLDSYRLAHQDDMTLKVRGTVYASLFPVWLQDTPAVQEQPDGWKYQGRFPLGTWLYAND